MLQLVSATCSHATLFRGCWACDLSQLHALNWRKQWSTRKLYAFFFFFLKSHVKKSGRSTDCYCRSLIICDSIWLFSIFSSIPPKKSWISRKLNILQKIRALLFLENLFRQVRVVFFFQHFKLFFLGHEEHNSSSSAYTRMFFNNGRRCSGKGCRERQNKTVVHAVKDN